MYVKSKSKLGKKCMLVGYFFVQNNSNKKFWWSIMIIKFQKVVPELAFYVFNGILPDTQIL